MLGDDPLAQRLEPQSLRTPGRAARSAGGTRAGAARRAEASPSGSPRSSAVKSGRLGAFRRSEHERVVGDADERRRENRRQGDVVVAVVQEPQVGEEVDDLLLAEVAAAGRAIGRQALAPQRFLVALCVRARGEEDDDLAGVGLAGVDELAHATRDPLRLARTPVLAGAPRSSPCR